MEIFIKEVSTKKEIKNFVLFPHSLYADNSYWVPYIVSDELEILDRNKNPSFEYCEARFWLAYKGKNLVGRIAGIINHAYNQKWGHRYVRFGWFDFVDDAMVSKALLQVVEDWAAERNMEAVHGPLGFTDFDPQGMLVDGFNELGVMSTLYNFSYYASHLERLGYRKDVDWLQYKVVVPEYLPTNIERIAQLVEKKYHLNVIKVKKASELRQYAKGVFELINKSYMHLYGVVTLSEKQITKYTNQYFSFIHPDYVSLVLQNEIVIAFAIAMPSLSSALQKSKGRLFPFGFIHFLKAFRSNDTADLYLMAVHPDFQTKGVAAVVIKDMHRKFMKNNISKSITHPMLEENTRMLSVWNYFEKNLYTRRRCYIKFFKKT